MVCTDKYFTPVIGFLTSGLKLKLVFIDCFESASCPKIVFLIYLCHHDCITTLRSNFKRFKV